MGKDAHHRKCMHEGSRIHEAMASSDLIACGQQKIHKMTPQQRQVKFGNQWYIVQTTARESRTIPTRQNPELGQGHRARMDCHSEQRATVTQAGRSSSQAQQPRLQERLCLSSERK